MPPKKSSGGKKEQQGGGTCVQAKTLASSEPALVVPSDCDPVTFLVSIVDKKARNLEKRKVTSIWVVSNFFMFYFGSLRYKYE